jgi:DNA primase
MVELVRTNRRFFSCPEAIMPNFVDFAAVKEAVSFSAAIELLDLKLKQSGNQWRGRCPTCANSGDRALVITEGRGFYCWGVKKGGDQIALAAHVLDLPAKEAAHELAKRAGLIEDRNSTGSGTSTSGRVQSRTVPESEAVGGSKLSPLSYLEPDDEAVAALGLDPAFCKEHGIGYASRGVVRGSVAIPFRDEHGRLLGYFGVQELTYIPPDFQTNVVRLPKRA